MWLAVECKRAYMVHLRSVIVSIWWIKLALNVDILMLCLLVVDLT